ncbi:putative viral polymerase [Hyptis latent virus]|uniref:Replicase n=1 Tax=Hyptis latent virus TaxID=2963947 RepID=A0AAE9SIJ2_9RHAB|nr:putative viral polymerase [Hyptis latent virus]
MDFLAFTRENNDNVIQNKPPLPDYHLRNPIKPLSWLGSKHKTSRQRKDTIALNEVGMQRITIGSHLDLYLDEGLQESGYDLATYTEIMEDVKLKIQVDNDVLQPYGGIPVTETIRELLKVENIYWSTMRKWNEVLVNMNAYSSERSRPDGRTNSDPPHEMEIGKYSLRILRTCVLIRLTHNTQRLWKVYDGDWVRLASDVYTQRFLFCLGSRVGKFLNPNQYPDRNNLLKIITWGDNLLRDLGNSGFKIIKTFEAIMVGVLQAKGASQVIQTDRFLKNTIRDLFDESPLYADYTRVLLDIVEPIDNMHVLTQIYGMHRIWGHPMVNSVKGMEKVITIGQKDIISDDSLSQDAGRMFKMLFCRAYKSKNGSYPPIVDSGTLLSTEILENDSAAVNLRNHDLSEWDRIKFRQIFQLPETFNLSMIVADKSVSPTRSELANLIVGRSTVMDPDLRRGVKRWLEDNTLDPIEFLKKVNSGQFPDDHKIIGLTPKERELNPTPRMFALMSHLLRVYVVVTEQLTSDYVLPMFPQITMTDTLLDLTKKTYSTVKNQSILNKKRDSKFTWASRVICMSLDFEKWNGHMRKSMTSGVFTAMGDLFGLQDIFNVTYDIFSECYYYLADGSYLPKVSKSGSLVVEPPHSFDGHKGGMEGLRQKGWTVFTVCALEVILSKHDCTYKIMGMGDNQVLQITVYTNQVDEAGKPTAGGFSEMRARISNVFQDLIRIFTSAGLPLKPLETWMSEDLYVYGKVPIWKGVPLAMDLKKIMRMFPFSNADVMTLENALATVSGNAISSTQMTSCILTPYVMSIVSASLCISDFMRYHPLLGASLWKESFKQDRWTLRTSTGNKHEYKIPGSGPSRREVLLAMLFVPRTMTGYNGVNILEMMMRGFPDNLSRDVSYLTSVLASEALPDPIRCILENWMEPIYMPEINYTTLVQDVTAVNLISPRSPSSGIKQVVTKFISGGQAIKNEEFKNLMMVKDKTQEEYLAELLCSGESLHIRLLHDIFEASIFGYVDSILSKVVKTTTIQRLAMKQSAHDIFDVITRDELIYMTFFRWRCTVKGASMKSNCPTSRCREMRVISWQKELRGITIPHPHSFMVMTQCSHARPCSCDDGYMSVHLPDMQMPDSMWFNNIGGCPPYLGSMTKEKVVVGAGGKVYSSEPLIRRPIKLLRIINWFVPEDSNTSDVIRSLVGSVSDLDPRPYEGVLEGAAGAEVHRYKDTATSHGALTSSSYMLSTRYHISSDHFHRYCRGTENTDIHFQALYCYIVECTNLLLHHSFRYNDLTPRFLHFRQSCYDCIKQVQEDFVDIPRDDVADVIPENKTNPYLYVSSSRIRVLEDRSPLSHLSPNEYTAKMYEKSSGTAKRQWLQDIIADRVTQDILGSSNDEEAMAASLLDVNSFERTMFLKLNPKGIISRVMGNLSLASEWAWLDQTGHSKPLSDEEIARGIITILSSSSPQGFIGIAMFFCWPETAKQLMMAYSEMVPPNTNPITIESSCLAVKQSLISLSLRQRWRCWTRFSVLSEDEKNSLWTIKKLLYMRLLKQSCLDCKRLVSRLRTNDIRRVKILSCASLHRTFDGMDELPWKRSFVTTERLRKDCEAWERTLTARSSNQLIPDMSIYHHTLFTKSDIIMRPTAEAFIRSDLHNEFPEGYYYYSPYHLRSVDTLPTKTHAKYKLLLSGYQREIMNRDVFMIGDGLGSSSLTLAEMGAKTVTVSTLLQPDSAIPQTYVHNVFPSSLKWSASNIKQGICPDKINDITDPRWIESWRPIVAECSVLVSDIEMFQREAEEQREKGLISALSLKSWDLVIYKDYIYSSHQMSNMLKIVESSRAEAWKCITTELRSSHYPECWWIIKNTTQLRKVGLGITPDRLNRLWNRFLERMVDPYPWIEDDDEMRMNMSIITDDPSKDKMMTYVRSWLSFPTVGLFYPDSGQFTRIYYYMKKMKSPAVARMQRFNQGLRMYNKDYYRLRDVMLCLALGMCSDSNVVCEEMVRTEYWYLTWENYRDDEYDCTLRRSKEPQGLRAEIDNYLPMVTQMLRSDGISFPELDSSVPFRSTKRSDQKVHFSTSRISQMSRRVLVNDMRYPNPKEYILKSKRSGKRTA